MSKPASNPRKGRGSASAIRDPGDSGSALSNAPDLRICFLLLFAVFAVYSQTFHFDFVSFDDPDYITANAHVRGGLSWTGIVWAFGSTFAGNWFPLTWLSHMLDCELFGVNAGWHHFTNVCLHALSVVLWFLILKRLTGARWRSALVALLFALHPLHVESVAWIAERKDVLSGLLWALTLWAYASYSAKQSRGRYAVALMVFCLGLMAKPMLVTLPLTLLLLDRWPLNRGTRIVEKIPFFAASAAGSLITYLTHWQAGATESSGLIPLGIRIENALVSYVIYIFKFIWPSNLAFFYPYPTSSLTLAAVLAGVGLTAVTVAAVRSYKQRPYLCIGWLWYLVTLLPVIGLLQAGAQARADRYTYIPMIGLSIALVWGMSEALNHWPRARVALAASVCVLCGVVTWFQVGYWRDSASLYQHAIDVSPDNYVAHLNLAAVDDARGDTNGAVEHLRDTVRIRPRHALAHAELGQLLAKQGKPEEALQELQAAITLQPGLAAAHSRMGSILGMLGRNREAAAEFAEGVRLAPDDADTRYNLAMALAQTGKLEEAANELRATVRLRPDDVGARFRLGITLAQLGEFGEAEKELTEVLRQRPDFNDAREALDAVIAAKRKSAGSTYTEHN